VVDFLSHSSKGRYEIAHVVHPNPVPWSTLASAIASTLSANVNLVSYPAWLEKLQTYISQHSSDSDLQKKLPASTLLEFYPSLPVGKEGREALGMQSLKFENAVGMSGALRSAPRLDEELARRWVAYWRGVGYI
jgi:hypothetical protein